MRCFVGPFSWAFSSLIFWSFFEAAPIWSLIFGSISCGRWSRAAPKHCWRTFATAQPVWPPYFSSFWSFSWCLSRQWCVARWKPQPYHKPYHSCECPVSDFGSHPRVLLRRWTVFWICALPLQYFGSSTWAMPFLPCYSWSRHVTSSSDGPNSSSRSSSPFGAVLSGKDCWNGYKSTIDSYCLWYLTLSSLWDFSPVASFL